MLNVKVASHEQQNKNFAYRMYKYSVIASFFLSYLLF